MKYTVDYFIKKFEAIPEENWREGTFGDVYDGKHCALGHCGIRHSDDLLVNEAAIGLQNVFDTHNGGTIDVVNVNDGHFIHYDQPTPKQRILAALYDIKKRQTIDYADTVINSIEQEIKINQLT